MSRPRKDEDVIRILRHKTNANSFQIASNHEIFRNEYVVCIIYREYIKIRLAGIDDTKDVRKCTKDGVNRRITITSHHVELPLGDLGIDQELSNNDEIIIFINQ